MPAILYCNSTLLSHTFQGKYTAADFLSRLEMDPNEKIILKSGKDIPTKPIEVNIESPGIAQEEPVFFEPTDQQETTEKKLQKH